jgi:hypothetical protein
MLVGVGLSRTGTTSLHQALGILGYRSSHFVDGTEQFWAGVILRRDYPYLAPAYQGFDAVSDIPAAHYFRQFHEQFPNSKFVLTWRSPDSWLASMHKHCRGLSVVLPNWENGFIGALHTLVYGSPTPREDAYLQRYAAHRQAVEALIPPGQLLVMNVCDGEGWEKLCPFLGRSIPPCPFPRADWMRQSAPSQTGKAP